MEGCVLIKHISKKWVVLLSFVATANLPLIASAQCWYMNSHRLGDFSFVPTMGCYYEDVYPEYGMLITEVLFKFDQISVDQVNRFKDGEISLPWFNGRKGCSLGGNNGYFTVDLTANPHAGKNKQRLSAFKVDTNLPYPKKDIEDSTGWNSVNEESEVVALGRLQANKWYYMVTYWIDNRKQDGPYGGVIGINFGISHQTFGNGYDYNNCFNSPS